MTSRPRGYADWRPHRKTEALLAQVDEVLAVYRAEWPLTVRQIFYRLVGRYEYPKDEHGYSRLGECLNRARRARRIPFSAIRDDGVVLTQFEWFDGPEGFWDDAARRAHTYRRDRQASQSQRIELWCEAAGMMPQLARIADEFSVPVRSASGFSSVTGNHDLAARVIGYSVPTVILHVGDFDPSGVSIFTAMVEDAAAFVEADRDRTLGDYENVSLRGVRVALTADQVEAYDLPTAPPKKSDSRSNGWLETCQVEALAPDDLALIVRQAITTEIDLSRWQEEVDQEHDDRIQVLRALPSGTGA